MVRPSEPATLSAPQQPWIPLDCIPISFTILSHILHQEGILVRSPRPFLHDMPWRSSASWCRRCTALSWRASIGGHDQPFCSTFPWNIRTWKIEQNRKKSISFYSFLPKIARTHTHTNIYTSKRILLVFLGERWSLTYFREAIDEGYWSPLLPWNL